MGGFRRSGTGRQVIITIYPYITIPISRLDKTRVKIYVAKSSPAALDIGICNINEAVITINFISVGRSIFPQNTVGNCRITISTVYAANIRVRFVAGYSAIFNDRSTVHYAADCTSTIICRVPADNTVINNWITG